MPSYQARRRQQRTRVVAAILAGSLVLGIIAATIGAVTGSSTDEPAADENDAADEQPLEADVLLYGDSLAWEARAAVELFLNAQDITVQANVIPGTAVCDALPVMDDDLTEVDPEVVVLEFVGNNSSACITEGSDEPLTGQALADRYAADAATATEQLVDHGVQVVWVQPPPSPGLPGGATAMIDQAYVDLVDDWADRAPDQVHYANAGEAVTTPDGSYTDSLPCLDDETPDLGCEDGQITVRNQDRIHFCPDERDDIGCTSTYSSGARRFGEAIAQATIPLLQDGTSA